MASASRPAPPYVRHDVLAGKYRIRNVLGEGGSAVVYAALDLTCDRAVALKVLRPGVSMRGRSARAMVQQEAATAVMLHQATPHVVDVLTAGVTDDAHALPFYVMELLEGVTLRTEIRQRWAAQRSFEILEVVGIAYEIAVALAAAHERGIVHRDLKPENVFLAEQRDRSQVVKLLDFGIASRSGDEEAAGSRRSFTGSKRYASPEQLEGHPVGPPTDLYALGLVLHEMLLLRLPHDRDSAALSAAQIALKAADSPPALRALRRDVPGDLDMLVGYCLTVHTHGRRTAPDAMAVLRAVRRDYERKLLGEGTVDAALTDVGGPPIGAVEHQRERRQDATVPDAPPVEGEVFFMDRVAALEEQPQSLGAAVRASLRRPLIGGAFGVAVITAVVAVVLGIMRALGYRFR